MDQTDLEGWATSLEYDVGRVKRSASTLRLTIPFRFAIRAGFSYDDHKIAKFEFSMEGKIVAFAEIASAQSLSPAVAQTPKRTRRNASLLD